MQKEIFEQPTAIGETLASLVDASTGRVVLPALPFDLARVSRFTCCACGTAYLATAVAKYWFEQIARQPVEIDIASEFRSEEHTSELQSLMRISYAVFCMKKKK